jgi:hypothetical protein
LDDGHLAGPPSILAQAFDRLKVEAHKMGIELNANKCKIWGPAVEPSDNGGQAELFTLPQIPWSAGQGLKVLGLPVEFPESHSFRQQSLQKVVDELAEAVHILGSLGHPQTQHLLLRYCLDTCRLMHFLRGVDCRHLQPQIMQARDSIRRCLGDILGFHALSDTQWLQSTLPLRLAGMGITDPVAIQPAARVASVLCFLERAKAMQLPQEAQQPPSDWVTSLQGLQHHLGAEFDPVAKWLQDSIPQGVEKQHRMQTWWAQQLYKAQLGSLQEGSNLRDSCRLHLQLMPHTTAWMEAIPNEGQGTRFGGPQYRALARWWLGAPQVNGEATDCPCCGGAMDVFGDHLVSCSKNQPTQRHNAVRDALAQSLRNHGITCRTEVAIGTRRRPADVALDTFDPRGPLALDLVLHHPLAPSASREINAMKASMVDEERRKSEESDELCHSNGWLFTPMCWHLWGGVGPQGAAVLQRLQKAIAGDSQGWVRIQKLANFRQRLSFTVMRYVGEQLLAAKAASGQGALPILTESVPVTPIMGPTFSPLEASGWDQHPKEYRVGPIRVVHQGPQQ